MYNDLPADDGTYGGGPDYNAGMNFDGMYGDGAQEAPRVYGDSGKSVLRPFDSIYLTGF